MLRGFVLFLGAAFLIGGIALFGVDAGPAIGLCVTGVLILVSTIFEKQPYKPDEVSGPPPGWRDTGERAVDEKTGAVTAVFVEPKTGERRYVRV